MVGIGAPLGKRTALVPICSSVKGDTRSGMRVMYKRVNAHREAYYSDRVEGLSIEPVTIDLVGMRDYNCAWVRPYRPEAVRDD